MYMVLLAILCASAGAQTYNQWINSTQLQDDSISWQLYHHFTGKSQNSYISEVVESRKLGHDRRGVRHLIAQNNNVTLGAYRFLTRTNATDVKTLYLKELDMLDALDGISDTVLAEKIHSYIINGTIVEPITTVLESLKLTYTNSRKLLERLYHSDELVVYGILNRLSKADAFKRYSNILRPHSFELCNCEFTKYENVKLERPECKMENVDKFVDVFYRLDTLTHHAMIDVHVCRKNIKRRNCYNPWIGEAWCESSYDDFVQVSYDECLEMERTKQCGENVMVQVNEQNQWRYYSEPGHEKPSWIPFFRTARYTNVVVTCDYSKIPGFVNIEASTIEYGGKKHHYATNHIIYSGETFAWKKISEENIETKLVSSKGKLYTTKNVDFPYVLLDDARNVAYHMKRVGNSSSYKVIDHPDWIISIVKNATFEMYIHTEMNKEFNDATIQYLTDEAVVVANKDANYINKLECEIERLKYNAIMNGNNPWENGRLIRNGKCDQLIVKNGYAKFRTCRVERVVFNSTICNRPIASINSVNYTVNGMELVRFNESVCGGDTVFMIGDDAYHMIDGALTPVTLKTVKISSFAAKPEHFSLHISTLKDVDTSVGEPFQDEIVNHYSGEDVGGTWWIWLIVAAVAVVICLSCALPKLIRVN